MVCPTSDTNADLTGTPSNVITGVDDNQYSTYAPLADAYNQSSSMNNFKNKLSSKIASAPQVVPSDVVPNEDPDQISNYDMDEIINNNPENPRFDRTFILDRNKRIPTKNLGSELLEPYDPLENLNAAGYRTSGLSFWKLLAIIILICIVIYAIYYLWKNNRTSGAGTGATANTSVGDYFSRNFDKFKNSFE